MSSHAGGIMEGWANAINHQNRRANSKSASVTGSMVIVSLGDTYADSCVVCGERGEWGLASKKGPEGCQEALNNGKVYCKTHLP